MSPQRTTQQGGPLPDPDTEPTIDVDRAARILGISIRAGYAACSKGDIPSVRIGRSIRVLTAQFLTKYGFTGNQYAA
jgi:Helix-turn-helix domain